MCDCINTLPTKALENLNERNAFKKPVESVSMREITFPIITNRLEVRTYTNLDIQLEGQARKKAHTIIHTFCPFCGQKYGEQTND